jgi:hypothetical protein
VLGALLHDRVSHPPLDVALQVPAVGWVDCRETKGGYDSIHCGWVKPAFVGELIDGASDCEFTVVRWPHLYQWD